MSVINQMLKDLEHRNPEQTASVTLSAHKVEKQSSVKLIVITSLSVLILCITSLYIWQLLSENQALKVKQLSKEQNLVKVSSNNAQEKLAPAKKAQVMTKPQEAVEVRQVKTVAVSKTEMIKAEKVEHNQSTKVAPAIKEQQIILTEEHNHPHVNAKLRVEKVTTTVTKPPQPNRMSVTRRQLSASELAQQKLALAEKALAAKQVEKAEKLFEDVLIITPNDSQTRKRLAALWFGRQAYQDAQNLLSQGIALNSKDASLRELKARIHLKQGQVTAAINTLKPLANHQDEQYQIMLANTAQQAQQNEIAIGAYQRLITMQPDLGRWQLGLAVLYDKTSQFTLARHAYQKALTKNDLSLSSEKFVKQRMQAIEQ